MALCAPRIPSTALTCRVAFPAACPSRSQVRCLRFASSSHAGGLIAAAVPVPGGIADRRGLVPASQAPRPATAVAAPPAPDLGGPGLDSDPARRNPQSAVHYNRAGRAARCTQRHRCNRCPNRWILISTASEEGLALAAWSANTASSRDVDGVLGTHSSERCRPQAGCRDPRAGGGSLARRTFGSGLFPWPSPYAARLG